MIHAKDLVTLYGAGVGFFGKIVEENIKVDFLFPLLHIMCLFGYIVTIEPIWKSNTENMPKTSTKFTEVATHITILKLETERVCELIQIFKKILQLLKPDGQQGLVLRTNSL